MLGGEGVGEWGSMEREREEEGGSLFCLDSGKSFGGRERWEGVVYML